MTKREVDALLPDIFRTVRAWVDWHLFEDFAPRCISQCRRSLPGATKQSGFCQAPGLLRGACHPAGHFGPDPLARNDEA
jgi:hypothetical protein